MSHEIQASDVAVAYLDINMTAWSSPGIQSLLKAISNVIYSMDVGLEFPDAKKCLYKMTLLINIKSL